MSSKRFRELQDEFFAISTRLQIARTPEEKPALLNELQRIVQESKQALVEPDSGRMLTSDRVATTQLAMQN